MTLQSCGSNSQQAHLTPLGKAIEIKAPLGLPPLRLPAGNLPTAETVALGHKLFFDPKVSFDNSVSCATCHNPGLDFTDGLPVSKGMKAQLGKRNAPTVLNAAYLPFQFWDGRAASLEQQAAGPIENPLEMSQPHDVFLKKLNADPAYRADFERAFGSSVITMDTVEMALASFERTMLSGNSPFDRYQYGHDPKAMSPSAIRGFAIFKDPQRGNCTACHSIDQDYALFTDGKFHNLGVGMNAEGELTDLGRYEQTKHEADKGAFLTPTLRNVAKTAPYMHDGSEKTLRQVVDFYAGGGNSNPQLDSEIKPIHLTEQDRQDLVAFLNALTGEPPDNMGALSTKR